MTEHDEALVFAPGDVKSLPHTLSQTRHLTLTLIGCDPAEGTAVFELRNPEAQPDEMVGGLIEDNLEDVERSNRHRDLLHLPEKPVPVDTETMPVEVLHCRLHERLQIGDREWEVTDIADGRVTLTPGQDRETPSLLNTVENAEYSPVGTAIEHAANTLGGGVV